MEETGDELYMPSFDDPAVYHLANNTEVTLMAGTNAPTRFTWSDWSSGRYCTIFAKGQGSRYTSFYPTKTNANIDPRWKTVRMRKRRCTQYQNRRCVRYVYYIGHGRVGTAYN